MANCYVYYRVQPAHAPEALGAVTAVMADILERTGIAGRLARRRDDADTWMEIYDDIIDTVAFERELDAAVLRHGVARWLAGGNSRKSEIFIPLG